MKDKAVCFFDFIAYWAIVVLPLCLGLSHALASVAMGWLIAAYFLGRVFRKKSLIPLSSVNIAFLGFLLAAGLSIANSFYLKDSLKGGILRLIEYFFIFLALTQGIKDRNHVKKIVAAIIVGISFVAFDCIWQIFTGHDLVRGYVPQVSLNIARATASFKISNLAGLYLSVLCPVLLGTCFYFNKKKANVILVFASMLVLAGIMLTQSRSAFLALYVGLWILSIVKKDRTAMIGLVLLALLVPLLMPANAQKYARHVKYNPVRFMFDDGRVTRYMNALNMIKDHPVIGIGINTFIKSYAKYTGPKKFYGSDGGKTSSAHSDLLSITCETGFLGLAMFIWLLAALLTSSWKIYRRIQDGYFKTLQITLIIGIIAFLVNGLTGSYLFYSRIALLFWYVAGLTLGMRVFAEGETT